VLCISSWGTFFKKAAIWEVSRRLATRVDYLPNIEKLSVTKIGKFGFEQNELWNMADLEKIQFDEDYYMKENYFWKLNIKIIDKDMVYRNKVTGEYLLFEQTGAWNWEGLSHSHLNNSNFLKN
jgi:hypothetical protein